MFKILKLACNWSIIWKTNRKKEIREKYVRLLCWLWVHHAYLSTIWNVLTTKCYLIIQCYALDDVYLISISWVTFYFAIKKRPWITCRKKTTGTWTSTFDIRKISLDYTLNKLYDESIGKGRYEKTRKTFNLPSVTILLPRIIRKICFLYQKIFNIWRCHAKRELW